MIEDVVKLAPTDPERQSELIQAMSAARVMQALSDETAMANYLEILPALVGLRQEEAVTTTRTRSGNTTTTVKN